MGLSLLKILNFEALKNCYLLWGELLLLSWSSENAYLILISVEICVSSNAEHNEELQGADFL